MSQACSPTFILTCIVHSAMAANDRPKIEWDSRARTLVQRHALYGRMIRLRSGDILLSCDRGGKVWVRRSCDNGKTWQRAVLVARYEFGVATNPEILQLENGWILASYNERPRNGAHPFAIVVCVSRDNGDTWGTPSRVYAADVRRENGCWEPAQLQLPSSEIQLFFANENPYRASHEQEITMLRSHDNGCTWGEPRRVCFRAGRRDGMPVPLLLRNNAGIVLAIEDNGLKGRMKPAIVFTTLEANWSGPHVDGNSPRRWSALRSPLPGRVYAGAPYIRQMPTGETVLSVQSTEGGRSKPRMVVYVGDENARDFDGRSVPFEIPPDTAGHWNSLFVKDEHTVTAISSTTIDGVPGLWAIDGQLVR